ncbi:3-(methylthio)propionyl-CoA ligase [Parvibaculum sp.]|jgi:fatty-acyl-CoA synthase|uniref:3-(methylthio)propionyl-CoA ligase n=1 Tax=Parvibaculum sp. TaxID=2024848 RepID=UPI000C53FB41|nr:3-(methylthio)propionyl-CoA ligase [Parvibaculum sp.]MAU62158.1 long-chain fatty acid--CoA ligase [Parvibaculum sp.]MBO6667051.1 fatty-acid--CoA ligase [Parvibaculum sp.]MBO6690495.1 fatty-acid--CoA ligase [Parvibaculum sp.]MBO6716129.1 fatty-acid--CoA ligase [Parvibaculum sp.]|tara:strand:- start:9401 stop:11041 length:1641 start_codon:yes stop_codon:yes gene_type:complete
MQGLMQDWPLRVTTIIDHAARFHGDREIVTRSIEGPITRTTYGQVHLRARKVAQALTRLGIKEGDIVATMAWNTARHLEAWYGIMGMGAVCHTLNPRLFAEQLIYIINHAEDKVIFLDLTFVPILEGIADKLPNVKNYVIMTDRAHMPETKLPNALCFEEIVEAEDGDFKWAEVDENAACGLCYTSGTTGNPKGVLYSHRSNVIHSMAANMGDALGMKCADAILPVVPMFHANAWGIAFAAPAVGAKIVMPGAQMDGQSIYELLDQEGVTVTAAVPTVWLMLLQHLEKTGAELPKLERVVIGGSAAPRSMIEVFEKNYDVKVFHAWGMTEMSPMGTLGALKAGMEDWPLEKQIDVKVKQGRAIYTVEMKITDDDGNELPSDGKAFGHLMVRGPAIAGAYLKGEGGNILDKDGWFDTGDVATIDPQGYMQITDRAKDVIKSGGEWISSIEIENLAVGHPKVAEAAVIGIAHPKWDERPLLIVVAKEGQEPTKDEILRYMEGKIAKWWMPDDVVFVDEIPHTATGKIQKLALREKFKDYTLPTANAAE